jgi:hypothetical protein
MLFTTRVVITVLCLALPLTRIYGVLGAVTTLYFYPAQTLSLLGVLVLGGLAYFQWRKTHA